MVATVGHEIKNEPLVMHSGRESTGFAAYRQGGATGMGEESAGGDHGVAVSEMSALTNELDGEGKAGKRDTA